jgi:hypothetical protein
MTHSQEQVKRFSVCSALISSSTGFRFMLSTVLLLKRMDTPYSVFATFDEALRFCRSEATKKKLVLPPEVTPI